MSGTSPEWDAQTPAKPRSKWLRRTLLLVVILAGAFLLAAYMNWLPSFIPNPLKGWRPLVISG